jgi:hypothetical protein
MGTTAPPEGARRTAEARAVPRRTSPFPNVVGAVVSRKGHPLQSCSRCSGHDSGSLAGSGTTSDRPTSSNVRSDQGLGFTLRGVH